MPGILPGEGSKGDTLRSLGRCFLVIIRESSQDPMLAPIRDRGGKEAHVAKRLLQVSEELLCLHNQLCISHGAVLSWKLNSQVHTLVVLGEVIVVGGGHEHRVPVNASVLCKQRRRELSWHLALACCVMPSAML